VDVTARAGRIDEAGPQYSQRRGGSGDGVVRRCNASKTRAQAKRGNPARKRCVSCRGRDLPCFAHRAL